MRLAFLPFFLTFAALPAIATPPSWELNPVVIATGSGHFDGAAQGIATGASQAATVSWLRRVPLVPDAWYAGWGGQAEEYRFTGPTPVPARLQDFALNLAVEYYQDGEQAAALNLHPGWYFSRHATARAWDVPFDATTGISIFPTLNGVAGVTNARFYHHALPIVGLVWSPTKRLRLQAVFPEPAVLVTLDPATTLRFGGELTGTGFLGDDATRRSVIEYSSYRIGLEYSRECRHGLRLSLGAGYELERRFDFFRTRGDLHGTGAGYLKVSAAFSP